MGDRRDMPLWQQAGNARPRQPRRDQRFGDERHKQGYRKSQTLGHAAKENLGHNGSIRREAKVLIPSSCRA